MKLSRLVFDIVKNVKYLADRNFTYDAFKNGDFNSDTDYANNIANVLAPLNEAIHRLSDMNKIRTKVEKPMFKEDGLIDLTKLEYKPKIVVSVAELIGNDYEKLPFRDLGKELLITTKIINPNNVKIEYRVDIPNFESIEFNIEDFELEDFGVTATMSSYIVEYCKGLLFENIDAGMANLHRRYAEQYFADLEEQQVAFTQRHIKNKLGVR